MLEVAKAVSFPVALSGLSAGIHRVYGPYNNVYLRANHFQALRKPVLALLTFLHVFFFFNFTIAAHWLLIVINNIT